MNKVIRFALEFLVCAIVFSFLSIAEKYSQLGIYKIYGKQVSCENSRVCYENMEPVCFYVSKDNECAR